MSVDTSQKLEPLLRASLDATAKERRESMDLSAGYQELSRTWELIVRYTGSDDAFLDQIQPLFPETDSNLPSPYTTTLLLGNYALLRLPQESIENLTLLPSVIYVEKPKRLFFETQLGRAVSCISSLQSDVPGGFTGRGVLVAIIDSGIDWTHPDFCNSDGSSRILRLWDQTLTPDGTLFPPEGYPNGVLFTQEYLNRLLLSSSEDTSLRPSADLSGHGTHVAGIAAGNGRASDGRYRGVAYESELIVVKLGAPGPNSFPSTSQLMAAVDFCVRSSMQLHRPLSVNLSFGNTYGAHNGSTLLETYLDTVSLMGQISICIGTGNEGVSAGHTGGVLTANQPTAVEFSVSDYTGNLSIQLWKNYWDEINLTISGPVGLSGAANLSLSNPVSGTTFRYRIGGTQLYIFIGEPSPYNLYQEVYIDFLPADTYLDAGIWTIRLQPQRIVDGLWDMWMPASAARSSATQFLLPTPDTTLTIPSSATRPITVGAYDALRQTTATFSGRGYTWNAQLIKPDLVAPGVDITSCAPGGGYDMRTGTSMATPFATGSCALLMQWGIIDGNDRYLYGDKIKAYLIHGARTFPTNAKHPNPETGWGALCLRESLPIFNP